MIQSPSSSCVLFDMDGIIIDSEPMQMEAFKILMAERGYGIGWDDISQLVGRRAYDNFAYLIDKFKLSEDPASLVERKNELYEILLNKNLHAMPGVVETVHFLSDRNVPLAVVSGSARKHVDLVLERLGLAPHFRMSLASEDVTIGKPDPEGFLKAASALGAVPCDSYVLEDSAAGVEAGRRGGFGVIAVPNAFTKDHDFSGALSVRSNMFEALDFFRQIYV